MTTSSDLAHHPHTAGPLPPRASGLRQFADAQLHPVWHALPDGGFDYVNGAWCSFTGLSQAASSSAGWQQAFHPEDLVRWQAIWDAGRTAGLPGELEFRLRRADGAYRWFIGRMEAIRDAHGQIAGWVGTATMLDERVSPSPSESRDAAVPSRLAEQWRRDQDLPAMVRQQNTVIAVAAHDMKNQIGVIRGMAQLVERRMRRTNTIEPERMLHDLGIIEAGTRKLQRQVDEFLDLTRVQSGEPVELNLQPTDLVPLVRACVDEYTQASDHVLTLTAAAASLIGRWDAARLERVVANLLSNAIKYSAPGTDIAVRVSGEGAGHDAAAVVSVRDNGVGVPEADLPHLFAPFYRASNVAQTTVGTGIGLFGARAVIEQQGGTVELESMVGVGTTVTVRLPLSE